MESSGEENAKSNSLKKVIQKESESDDDEDDDESESDEDKKVLFAHYNKKKTLKFE